MNVCYIQSSHTKLCNLVLLKCYNTSTNPNLLNLNFKNVYKFKYSNACIYLFIIYKGIN